MIYIVLSIFCSVTVGVLLKLSKRYQINVLQAVMVNYVLAIALSYFFYQPQLNIHIPNAAWSMYAALGVLMPSIFLILARSVQLAGLAKTDIAQRLSLFIALTAAFFWFKESFSALKLAGSILALSSIVLILNRPEKSSAHKSYTLPLLLVFLGFGVVDVLFKQLATLQAVPYTTSLFIVFIMAFLVSVCFVLYKRFRNKEKIQGINLFCGIILGLFNFGNILFYLKAHRALSDNPSVVFACMNLGVIIFGALIGLYVFKEALSKMNYIGLFMAIFAVLLITISLNYAF